MKRGDIILIKYPFSDLSSTKVRPAIVVSSDACTQKGQDAIFIAISSNISNAQATDLVFDQTNPEFHHSGLKNSSLMRTEKIFCLSKGLASRMLGSLGPSMTHKLNQKLHEVLDLE